MGLENLIASRLVSDNVLMQFLNPWRHILQKYYIDYMFLLHIFSGLYVFFILQGGEKHPGMDLLYEYHSNQTGDSENVLMHALGHWRLTKHFHDLVFLPQVTVSLSNFNLFLRLLDILIRCCPDDF